MPRSFLVRSKRGPSPPGRRPEETRPLGLGEPAWGAPRTGQVLAQPPELGQGAEEGSRAHPRALVSQGVQDGAADQPLRNPPCKTDFSQNWACLALPGMSGPPGASFNPFWSSHPSPELQHLVQSVRPPAPSSGRELGREAEGTPGLLGSLLLFSKPPHRCSRCDKVLPASQSLGSHLKCSTLCSQLAPWAMYGHLGSLQQQLAPPHPGNGKPEVRSLTNARCAAKPSARAPTSSPTAASIRGTSPSPAPCVPRASSARWTCGATRRSMGSSTAPGAARRWAPCARGPAGEAWDDDRDTRTAGGAVEARGETPARRELHAHPAQAPSHPTRLARRALLGPAAAA